MRVGGGVSPCLWSRGTGSHVSRPWWCAQCFAGSTGVLILAWALGMALNAGCVHVGPRASQTPI